jgi:hypothetical protein
VGHLEDDFQAEDFPSANRFVMVHPEEGPQADLLVVDHFVKEYQ